MNIALQDPQLTVYCGDALEVLRTLPAESVQCVVTSPPYDDLRTYGGRSSFDWGCFSGVARGLFRVLADGGVCCWNVCDQVIKGSETLSSFRQALYFRDEVGFRVHDTMIYQKFAFSHPEQCRYHQVFEYVFVFSKGQPRAFNPIRDKKNATAGMTAFGTSTFARPDGTRFERATQGTVSAEFGMRGNVWAGKTRGQEEICQSKPHPAMMPKWLARDLILSWSNPGDTVLDSFAGSGTTGEAALELGRKTILIEINPDYIPIIEGSTRVRALPLMEHAEPLDQPPTISQPDLDLA